MTTPPHRPLARIGWREWISLPDLSVGPLQAKVDTGAKTSALHAVDLRVETLDGQSWVIFRVPPRRPRGKGFSEVQTKLHGYREVRSSNGSSQTRPVIATHLHMGEAEWPILLTLANRQLMGFRMLLGREALNRRVLIDPANSFLLGKPTR